MLVVGSPLFLVYPCKEFMRPFGPLWYGQGCSPKAWRRVTGRAEGLPEPLVESQVSLGIRTAFYCWRYKSCLTPHIPYYCTRMPELLVYEHMQDFYHQLSAIATHHEDLPATWGSPTELPLAASSSSLFCRDSCTEPSS